MWKMGACKDYRSRGTLLSPRNSDADQQPNVYVHANLRSEKSRLRDIEMKQIVVFGSPNLDSFFITRCSHLSKPEVAKLLPMPPICSPHPVSVWSINGELFSYFKKNGWKNIKRGLKPHDMGELYEIQILSPINSFTETWPCLFNSPSLPCSLSPAFPSPAILPYNLGRSWSGDFLPYSPSECRVPGLQACTSYSAPVMRLWRLLSHCNDSIKYLEQRKRSQKYFLSHPL